MKSTKTKQNGKKLSPSGINKGGKPAPLALGGIVKSRGPTILSRNSNKIVVSRREFVGTATNASATSFVMSAVSVSMPGYDFNPSEPTMFPWLSQIANSYERFRFNRVNLEFVPSAAASTAGRYYVAVDYDYDDAVPTTKAGMMGNATAVEAAIWQPCRLECDPRALNADMPARYVSCTTRGLAVEGRTAFAGYMMIAFDTPTANQLVDIWVEYEVELSTPVYDAAFIQDPGWGTDSSYTELVPAQGTGYARAVPASFSANPAGAVRYVLTGQAGIPVLRSTIFGSAFTYPYALDIKDANGKGILELTTAITAPALSPEQIILNSPIPEFSVLDSLGNYLISVSTLTGNQRVWGAKLPAELTLAGKTAYTTVTLLLRNLLREFPSARFLAPLVTLVSSAMAAEPGSLGFKYRYSV